MRTCRTSILWACCLQRCSTLSNDSVSQEAKEHAQEQLKALGAGNFDYESKVPDEQDKNPGNVAGGLKA